MRFYTVHVRHRGLDPDRDIALVKEGFSWPAFIFGPLWALARRLWLAAAGWIAAMGALRAAEMASGLDPATGAVLALGLSAAFGWLGNNLARRKLDQGGFAFMGVVEGDNRDAALKRFLDRAPALAADLALTVRP